MLCTILLNIDLFSERGAEAIIQFIFHLCYCERTMATACDLEPAFKEYIAAGKELISTKDVTQLLTHAGYIKKTGKYSSNNVDIVFTKHKTKGKTGLTLAQFTKFIEDLAGQKPANDVQEVVNKLNATKKADHMKAATSKTGGVTRLTDASKYTGSHKERFDESGKGKGAEGRVDKVDGSGYVGNYKGANTFDNNKK